MAHEMNMNSIYNGMLIWAWIHNDLCDEIVKGGDIGLSLMILHDYRLDSVFEAVKNLHYLHYNTSTTQINTDIFAFTPCFLRSHLALPSGTSALLYSAFLQ